MSIVPTKGSSEQQATEFAYASCAYSCVASERLKSPFGSFRYGCLLQRIDSLFFQILMNVKLDKNVNKMNSALILTAAIDVCLN